MYPSIFFSHLFPQWTCLGWMIPWVCIVRRRAMGCNYTLGIYRCIFRCSLLLLFDGVHVLMSSYVLVVKVRTAICKCALKLTQQNRTCASCTARDCDKTASQGSKFTFFSFHRAALHIGQRWFAFSEVGHSLATSNVTARNAGKLSPSAHHNHYITKSQKSEVLS